MKTICLIFFFLFTSFSCAFTDNFCLEQKFLPMSIEDVNDQFCRIILVSYFDLETSANEGNLGSQILLAKFHFGAPGLVIEFLKDAPDQEQQDYSTALYWFKEAFENGSKREAGYYLSLMYFLGKGTQKNHQKAFYYLSNALGEELNSPQKASGEIKKLQRAFSKLGFLFE